MSHIIFAIFLAIHIGSVIAWFGSSLFFGYSLGPSLTKLDDKSRREAIAILVPRLVNYILASAVATISAGLLTLGYVGSAEQSLVPRQWGLLSLIAGAVLGFVAAMVSFAILHPVSRKLMILSNAANPSSTDMLSDVAITSALESLKDGTRIISTLLGIVMVLMIIAGNIRA